MNMRYIISESKYDNFIYEYIDKLFPREHLNFGSPYITDEQGNEVEDKDRVEFWFDVGRDEDVCFRWYGCDYFYSNAPLKQHCPFVILENIYDNKLNSLFQDSWKPIFKKWFTNNSGLPIKTVLE